VENIRQFIADGDAGADAGAMIARPASV